MQKITSKRNSILISAILAVLFFFGGVAFCDDSDDAIITAYDVYVTLDSSGTRAGTVFNEAYLKAKLEDEGALNVNSDIEGETLTFYVDGRFAGKAVTDENGFAKVAFLSEEKKHHELTVKLEGSKEYKADEDSAIIYMVDPKKPTIISDIDWTVSNTDKSSLILKSSDDESTPIKDSPEVMSELSKHYNIIFVTGREDALLKKTREWLKKWKFPLLPVYYADFGQTPYIKQGEYKEKAVKKIKDDIKNVTIGIGDMPHDAKAYLKSGLKAYIVKKSEDQPEGAVIMPDWLSIKNELLKEEHTKLK